MVNVTPTSFALFLTYKEEEQRKRHVNEFVNIPFTYWHIYHRRWKTCRFNSCDCPVMRLSCGGDLNTDYISWLKNRALYTWRRWMYNICWRELSVEDNNQDLHPGVCWRFLSLDTLELERIGNLLEKSKTGKGRARTCPHFWFFPQGSKVVFQHWWGMDLARYSGWIPPRMSGGSQTYLIHFKPYTVPTLSKLHSFHQNPLT